MKLDDLLTEWDKDAKLDKTELGDAALNISKLHAKWLRIRAYERLRLVQMQSEQKTLKLAKYEFYTMGPTNETQSLGWKLPPKGIILKADLPTYMDADKELIDSTLKVALQAEIVDAVDLVLKAISAQNWNIRAAIDDTKFKGGV